MDNKEIVKTLQELIDTLGKCEKDNKDCRKCKLRKNGCLKFIRSTIAVALGFILTDVATRPIPYKEYNLYI